ncbi:MAG: hypothetical protein US48_C0048G0002 [Candidatus Levybacteria bacterium GW2011_GWA2_37_36]|nr:MAG: hypothetical protein US48_C0048G0002 [Candidatus Levybacteria bacterium GW2011_GWA2_37_36]OGH50148.1 MAG: hypothetical protein A3H17_01540 [Candidatus Levybacteria bacterium RIFCSPLOWO2_12_FULL_37_14]
MHIERQTDEGLALIESVIPPSRIRERVMDFFRGVDLDAEGTTQKGILTIITVFEDRTALGKEYHGTTNHALVNGFEVARYARGHADGILTGTSYSLFGKDFTEISCFEDIQDNKPLLIDRVTRKGHYVKPTESIGTIESIANTLGIKV